MSDSERLPNLKAESIAAESRDADSIDLLCSDSILDNLTPGVK